MDFRIRLAICAAGMLALASCSMTPTTPDERTPVLKYKTGGVIAVAIVDNRPYVTNGSKDDNFEGIGRTGYGIPTDFVKQRDDSKTTYVARVSDVVVRALEKSGSHVTSVSVPKGSYPKDAIAILHAASASPGLIVNVLDSRIDAGGFRWSYFFNYQLIVVDSNGVVISDKSFSGEDVDFQRDIFHAASAAGKTYSFPSILDMEYKNKFSEFLGEPDTSSALTGSPTHIVSDSANHVVGTGVNRLAALKSMLDQGLITNDDYEKKKAEILQSL